MVKNLLPTREVVGATAKAASPETGDSNSIGAITSISASKAGGFSRVGNSAGASSQGAGLAVNACAGGAIALGLGHADSGAIGSACAMGDSPTTAGGGMPMGV